MSQKEMEFYDKQLKVLLGGEKFNPDYYYYFNCATPPVRGYKAACWVLIWWACLLFPGVGDLAKK